MLQIHLFANTRSRNHVVNHADGERCCLQEHRWQGGLSADYRLSGSRRFRLSVHSHLTRRPIRNMIATMKGDVEPDRWVMVGNHVDAWVKGAIDPATGTAAQLEVGSRTVVSKKKKRSTN